MALFDFTPETFKLPNQQNAPSIILHHIAKVIFLISSIPSAFFDPLPTLVNSWCTEVSEMKDENGTKPQILAPKVKTWKGCRALLVGRLFVRCRQKDSNISTSRDWCEEEYSDIGNILGLQTKSSMVQLARDSSLYLGDPLRALLRIHLSASGHPLLPFQPVVSFVFIIQMSCITKIFLLCNFVCFQNAMAPYQLASRSKVQCSHMT